MNRRQYEKWYPYGASTYNKTPQTDPIHVKRYANFQLFLDHNPNVVPVATDPVTQQSLLEGGNYSWGYGPTHHSIQFRGCGWDHTHFIRIKGVRKSHIAVTHMYGKGYDLDSADEHATPKGLLKGLQARSYDKKYDWYIADNTTLQFISTPERLDMLNLEYLGEPLRIVDGAMKYRKGY